MTEQHVEKSQDHRNNDLTMFTDISEDRLVAMTGQELRWLDNVRKAFHASDLAYASGKPQNGAMEELCKAIDTAKSLRRSLRGESPTTKNNKELFVEFLELEIPDPSQGGLSIDLVDARTGQVKSYSFASLVYAIRCMVHENENLNAAEDPDYHIQLDWSCSPHAIVAGQIRDGRLICNGHVLWNILRQVLAKFVTGIDGMISFAKHGSFSIAAAPPLGSIRPVASRHTT